MVGLLTVALFLSALALIILVLIQPDRSRGVSGGIGSGGSSVFGVSQDGGPLAQATKVVAILFIVISLLLYLIK